MRRIAASLLLLLVLAGCETIKVITFSEDAASGVKSQTATALFLAPAYQQGEDLSLPAGLQPGAAESIRACVGAPPASEEPDIKSALPVALIAYAVEQGIQHAVDQLNSRAERIAKESVASYKATAALSDPQSFGNVGQCLVFMRGERPATEGAVPDKPGLILIMRVVDVDGPAKRSAFRIEPYAASVVNFAAITASGEPVSIAVGFAGLQIHEDGSKNVKSEFGTGAFSFASLRPGDIPSAELPDGTGLITMPRTDAQVLELSIAITETGSGAPDKARAAAEIDAIQKAIGPQIKALIEAE